MKPLLAILCVTVLLLLAVLLHTPIKDFLWVHPWWQSTLVALPTIALAVFAFLELRHTDEANELRRKIADLEAQRNQHLRRIADLEAERNQHLQQIAENLKKPVTQAERNAAILRQHLRAKVKVSEEQGTWGEAAEIVEVSNDNIATLFSPRSYLSSRAWCVRVNCDNLQITEIPEGSCPLRIKVLKRYGPDVQLGEITKWEDRLQPSAVPTASKGPNAFHAMYAKAGTSETRSLNVYASSDGRNSFVLEASTGERLTGDNVEISKRFMLLQIEYEAAGFGHRGSGTGGSPFPLFIKT